MCAASCTSCNSLSAAANLGYRMFATGADPIKVGLVESYNRPGGNATGINFLTADMEAKRLGLLHELMPQTALTNNADPPSHREPTNAIPGAI